MFDTRGTLLPQQREARATTCLAKGGPILRRRSSSRIEWWAIEFRLAARLRGLFMASFEY